MSLSGQDAQRYAEGNAVPASFAQQMNQSKASNVSFVDFSNNYNHLRRVVQKVVQLK